MSDIYIYLQQYQHTWSQLLATGRPEVFFECRLCSCSSSTAVVQLSQASPEKKDTKTQSVSIIMLAAEIIMKTAIGPQVPPADCCNAYRGRIPHTMVLCQSLNESNPTSLAVL